MQDTAQAQMNYWKSHPRLYARSCTPSDPPPLLVSEHLKLGCRFVHLRELENGLSRPDTSTEPPQRDTLPSLPIR